MDVTPRQDARPSTAPGDRRTGQWQAAAGLRYIYTVHGSINDYLNSSLLFKTICIDDIWLLIIDFYVDKIGAPFILDQCRPCCVYCPIFVSMLLTRFPVSCCIPKKCQLHVLPDLISMRPGGGDTGVRPGTIKTLYLELQTNHRRSFHNHREGPY